MSRRRQRGKILEKIGIAIEPEAPRLQESGAVKLRVIVREPRSGYHHPAGKQDILEFLGAIGPIALYGLRTVELVPAPLRYTGAAQTFGSYHVAGRIMLYEQPLPPWRLCGRISPKTSHQFERAGAVLTWLPDIDTVAVDWPAGTLRRFMLEEVLLHEVGHHVLQQHKGKRPVRIARTRDHEVFAERFADKQRTTLAKRRRREG